MPDNRSLTMTTIDTAHALQEAARNFARHIAPSTLITHLTIHGPTGKIVTLPLPEERAEPVTDPEAAAIPGWDFSRPTPRFDGTVVPIHGRKLDVLKVLAASPVPLTILQLKAAWHDYEAEDGTVRWTIGDLRRTLRELFTDLDDPVHNGPEGYSLTIR
jgi:hypothetical protein